MASSNAWELLDKFRREWATRKTEPREEDWAELIDDAIWQGYHTDRMFDVEREDDEA